MFQSPRSGKFESNLAAVALYAKEQKFSFNPLDRGNLNQILNGVRISVKFTLTEFQSPRSGKFESNSFLQGLVIYAVTNIVSIP